MEAVAVVESLAGAAVALGLAVAAAVVSHFLFRNRCHYSAAVGSSY